MNPLRVDDPVTVLDETGKLLVQARWNGDGAHVYRYGTAGRVSMPNTVVRMADEGTLWCRGHVTDKDDEGRALLVAAALTDSGGKRIRFADNTPTASLRGRTGRIFSGGVVRGDGDLPATPSDHDIFFADIDK